MLYDDIQNLYRCFYLCIVCTSSHGKVHEINADNYEAWYQHTLKHHDDLLFHHTLSESRSSTNITDNNNNNIAQGNTSNMHTYIDDKLERDRQLVRAKLFRAFSVTDLTKFPQPLRPSAAVFVAVCAYNYLYVRQKLCANALSVYVICAHICAPCCMI